MWLPESRLVDMALVALEEVAALCHEGPVARSRALALVLAFLASRQLCRRDVFDSFWRAVDHRRPQDRWTSANAALAVGRKRDLTTVSHFEGRARAKDFTSGPDAQPSSPCKLPRS